MYETPLGFFFATAAAGFRHAGRDDLAFIGSDVEASAGGVFTANRFQAAPVHVARANLAGKGKARGILVNSGQANACTGEAGVEDCRETLKLVAQGFDLEPEEILPASTGVIGERFRLEDWKRAAVDLFANARHRTPLDAAKAITTTDTFPKLAWRSFDASGETVRVLGLAKGAGMICPNMATMLAFVLTDAALPTDLWQDMLRSASEASFNRMSIDGDTSTNDCLLGLANGRSEADCSTDQAAESLRAAVSQVCLELSRLIVEDAEGGTKVITLRVQGAADEADAAKAARCVAHSPLVKTAFFGRDPNWGRIVAALGRSGAVFEPENVEIAISGRTVFRRGGPTAEDVDSLLAPQMRRRDIELLIDLGQGSGRYEMLTSDLSLDYVRINAEYRT
jgi:glutamate N-acetyltransferase/amino-acid N-acetyltransferase